MTRFWKTVIPTCALLGLSAAAFALPDDFQATIAKAQQTLSEIDRTIGNIEVRKSGQTVSAVSVRSARTRASSARRATGARTPARARNARPANRNANRNRNAAPKKS